MQNPRLKQNPDEGFGRPGSLQWHTLHINECETISGVFNYATAITGTSRADFFEMVKTLAVQQIKEYLDGQSK